MAIVVGENSYVTELELTSYAAAREITVVGTHEVLLIKAMDYIETRPFAGVKNDSTQDLFFPVYPDDEVPQDIKTAQIVTALLIDSGVNLFETVGRAIKREKVDILETEYMDNASSVASYPQLDSLLAPFYSSGFGGIAVVRG